MSKRFQRSLLAAFTIAALAACQDDTARLEEHMIRGDGYFEEEKYPEAIIEYKNVLQLDPNRADAHYGLAKSYLKERKAREAFWELRETVRIDPSKLEARRELSGFLIFANEFEEALAQGEALVAADPDDFRGYAVRAAALEGLRRPEDAIEELLKAVQVAPEVAGPMLALGNAYAQRGEHEEAESWYAKSIAIEPTYAAYSTLANHIVRQRDSARDQEAVDNYHKAIELASNDEEKTRAYQVLGSFYFARDRGDEGIQIVEEGIDSLEDPLDLMYALARYYASLGKEEKSEALIRRATAERPDDPRPFLILSAYKSRKGDPDGALAAVKRALEVDPDDLPSRLRMAEVLIESGAGPSKAAAGESTDMAEGREIVEAILAEDPRETGALLVKAKLDLFEGHHVEAIAGLRTAIDQRPDWAQAHFILGAAFAMQGEPTAARAELARALELDAGMLEARKVLAQVHASLGEHEYALEEGRRFLRLRPEVAQTRILVAQSLVRLGRREEALRELAMVEKDQETPEVLYAFARIHMANRDYDRAREYLTRAVAQRPSDPDILRNLFRLDQIEGKPEDSIANIDAAIAANPTDPRLQVLRGSIFIVTRDIEAAEAAFKRAVEIDPNYLAAYEQLARLYALSGRLEQAIDTYERAVAARPNAAPVHHLLGVLYEMSDQSDRAIASYQTAIRYQPNLAESKNNLAYIFAESQVNLDRALDLAQEAKALLPDNPNAADTLGWVLYRRGIPSAAISYLKEAEAGTDQNDASLGVIRHHLAQAYDANGDKEMAVQTLSRALTDLEIQLDAERKRGAEPQEPAWSADVRTMLKRLQTEG